MKRFLVFLLALNFLFSSCKKEEDSSQTGNTITASDYFPLSVGSYWIYDVYQIATDGSETKHPNLDSVYISSDTLIDGHIYSVFKSDSRLFPDQVFRDSSGYLIGPSGHIAFAPNNSEPILSTRTEFIGPDTFYVYTNRMEKVAQAVSVPAGLFTPQLLLRQTYEVKLGSSDRTLEFLEYRTPRIGAIISQFGTASGSQYTERRLLRYKLGPTTP